MFLHHLVLPGQAGGANGRSSPGGPRKLGLTGGVGTLVDGRPLRPTRRPQVA